MSKKEYFNSGSSHLWRKSQLTHFRCRPPEGLVCRVVSSVKINQSVSVVAYLAQTVARWGNQKQSWVQDVPLSLLYFCKWWFSNPDRVSLQPKHVIHGIFLIKTCVWVLTSVLRFHSQIYPNSTALCTGVGRWVDHRLRQWQAMSAPICSSPTPLFQRNSARADASKIRLYSVSHYESVSTVLFERVIEPTSRIVLHTFNWKSPVS